MVVAKELGQDGFTLGIKLGVRRAEMLSFKANHGDNLLMLNYKILVSWRETSINNGDDEVMIEELFDVLKELNHVHIVEQMRKGECWIEPCRYCSMI